MEDETTRKLSSVLEHIVEPEEADSFLIKYADKEKQYFYQYFNEYIAYSGIAVADVIRRSGINKNYVYNILNGRKLNPGRDKVLALCIGAGMTFKQTNRALEISKLASLYPKNSRDILITLAINTGMNDVLEVNIMLDDNGAELLDI